MRLRRFAFYFAVDLLTFGVGIVVFISVNHQAEDKHTQTQNSLPPSDAGPFGSSWQVFPSSSSAYPSGKNCWRSPEGVSGNVRYQEKQTTSGLTNTER